MYVDKDLLISDGQSLTTSGTNTSTYSVDLAAVRDIGKGRQLYVVIGVDVSAHSDDVSDTVLISLVTDDDVALDSVTTVLQIPTITGALLTAGRMPIILAIPPGISERYIGLNYYLSSTFTSGLKLTAFVALDVQTNIK